MKKTTAPKRNMGRLIVKNLIVLLAIVVAVFIGTQSWFTTQTKADASGVNIQATLPPDIEIAIVPKGYNNNQPPDMSSDLWKKGSDGTIQLNAVNYPAIFNSLALSDINGDGTNFYKPLMKQDADGARPDTTIANQWSTASSNTDYIGLDIYARILKSGTYTTLNLLGTSSISPNSALTPPTPTYDAVIGAVRCSFKNSSSQTKIWIPAPHVHYDGTDKVLSTTYKPSDTFYIPYKDSSGNKVSGNGFSHYYYTVSGTTATLSSYSYPNTNVIVNSLNADSSDSNNTFELGSNVSLINFSTTSGDYKYGKTTVNVWIEGEDTEARLATVEGKFKIAFNFSAN